MGLGSQTSLWVLQEFSPSSCILRNGNWKGTPKDEGVLSSHLHNGYCFLEVCWRKIVLSTQSKVLFPLEGFWIYKTQLAVRMWHCFWRRLQSLETAVLVPWALLGESALLSVPMTIIASPHTSVRTCWASYPVGGLCVGSPDLSLECDHLPFLHFFLIVVLIIIMFSTQDCVVGSRTFSKGKLFPFSLGLFMCVLPHHKYFFS